MQKIGLVLSGGMAKGSYQVGALRAISEYFTPGDFQFVSAASVGALNAYAFLSNQLDKAEKVWHAAATDHYSVMVASLLRNAFVQNSIHDLISDDPIENSFFVPLLDFSKRTLAYFDLHGMAGNEIETYLNASVALPFLNTGVSIDGVCYFDGAMVDNIPLYPLLEKDLDYIILIYFDNQNVIFESKEFDDRIIKLSFPDASLRSSLKLTTDAVTRTTALGYQRTKSILAYVFQNGIDDTDGIRKKIKRLNNVFPSRKVHISGDILVAQMNRVASKLARRRVISGESGGDELRRIISVNHGPTEIAGGQVKGGAWKA